MRVYIHGAGRTGRSAFPASADDADARFLSLDFADPMERNAALLSAATPAGSVIVAHSAGAVPVFLALAEEAVRPSALVLIEPGLYDIARGNPAIESHVATMTRARELSAVGDLFGYWRIVRPLMFGGDADPARWDDEKESVARFEAKRPPWGHPVTSDAIHGIPTLVITGDWNAEYEAIAAALVSTGAVHEKLRGNTHRPQDHPDFTAVVDAFVRRS